jgi:hypothetical protein
MSLIKLMKIMYFVLKKVIFETSQIVFILFTCMHVAELKA